jgi:Mn2+/Fe2+ NRAMP family transporter
LTVPLFTNTARDKRLVASFAIAGLIVPFALYPLWWAATRDRPLIGRDTFLLISSVLFPGQRGVFLGWLGPTDQTKVATMWLRALAQNAIVYAIVGSVVVAVRRSSRMLRGVRKSAES